MGVSPQFLTAAAVLTGKARLFLFEWEEWRDTESVAIQRRKDRPPGPSPNRTKIVERPAPSLITIQSARTPQNVYSPILVNYSTTLKKLPIRCLPEPICKNSCIPGKWTPCWIHRGQSSVSAHKHQPVVCELTNVLSVSRRSVLWQDCRMTNCDHREESCRITEY